MLRQHCSLCTVLLSFILTTAAVELVLVTLLSFFPRFFSRSRVHVCIPTTTISHKAPQAAQQRRLRQSPEELVILIAY